MFYFRALVPWYNLPGRCSNPPESEIIGSKFLTLGTPTYDTLQSSPADSHPFLIFQFLQERFPCFVFLDLARKILYLVDFIGVIGIMVSFVKATCHSARNYEQETHF